MVVRGAFYTVLSRIAFLASGYAIQVSMAYLLLPSEYGTLGVIMGLVTLWRVFLSSGLPQTATQFIAGDEQRAHSIWRKALKIQVLASIALWVVYVLGTPLWSRLLNDDSLKLDILLSSLLIPFMAWFQVNLGYFGGLQQFGRQSLYIGIYSVVRLVLALALVLLGLKIHGVVLSMTLSVLVVALLTHVGVPRRKTELEGPNWRELAAFSLPLIPVSFGISALLNLDLLVLKRFFPESADIGYYNGAVNLGKAPYFLLSSLAATLLPSVSKALGAQDREGALRLVSKHASYVLLISLPCIALVAASPEKLLDFVYPETYAKAGPALTILVCSMSGLALLSVLTAAMTAAGRPKAAMLVVLACVPLQCLLSVFVVPRYGMAGTASANLVTVLVGVVWALWIVRRQFGGVLELGRVSKAAAISAVIGLAFAQWQTYPVLALPALYCLGLALYVAAMFAVGAVTTSERELAKRVLRRLRLSTAE